MDQTLKPSYLKPVDIATLQAAVIESQKAATKQCEDVVRTTVERLGQTCQQTVSASEQFAWTAQESSQACAQAATAWSKSCEELSRCTMAWSQNVLEQAMSTWKQMLTVRTLREYVDLQTAFNKYCMDGFVHQCTQVTDVLTRCGHQVSAPWTKNFSSSVEKWSERVSKKDAA